MPGHYHKALKGKMKKPAEPQKADTPAFVDKQRGRHDMAKAHGGVSKRRKLKDGSGKTGLFRKKKKKY